jgi:hypothetical protein
MFTNEPLILSSPGLKWPGCEADYSPPSSAEVKNCWIILPLHHTSSWHSAQLITHKNKFTSPYRELKVKNCYGEEVVLLYNSSLLTFWGTRSARRYSNFIHNPNDDFLFSPFVKHVGNKLSFATKDVSSCTFTKLRGISHFQQRIIITAIKRQEYKCLQCPREQTNRKIPAVTTVALMCSEQVSNNMEREVTACLPWRYWRLIIVTCIYKELLKFLIKL